MKNPKTPTSLISTRCLPFKPATKTTQKTQEKPQIKTLSRDLQFAYQFVQNRDFSHRSSTRYPNCDGIRHRSTASVRKMMWNMEPTCRLLRIGIKMGSGKFQS
ncbi:hypothetical protein V8G54_009666 [Vigna mungo]|uniref:Uncharacterized protein n=1 Tax=Vigna mungo TaxID=3915 RepID=A0AAQ3S5Q2_VIGMU